MSLFSAPLAVILQSGHKGAVRDCNCKKSAVTALDSVVSNPNPGLYSPWILQARILEWVAFPFYQRIEPIQGLNPGLPALWADSLPAEPPGKT